MQIFQILEQERYSVSIENLLRFLKFELQIPGGSEDINNMQIQFSQKGKSPRSGMHRGSSINSTGIWSYLSIPIRKGSVFIVFLSVICIL